MHCISLFGCHLYVQFCVHCLFFFVLCRFPPLSFPLLGWLFHAHFDWFFRPKRMCVCVNLRSACDIFGCVDAVASVIFEFLMSSLGRALSIRTCIHINGTYQRQLHTDSDMHLANVCSLLIPFRGKKSKRIFNFNHPFLFWFDSAVQCDSNTILICFIEKFCLLVYNYSLV